MKWLIATLWLPLFPLMWLIVKLLHPKRRHNDIYDNIEQVNLKQKGGDNK